MVFFPGVPEIALSDISSALSTGSIGSVVEVPPNSVTHTPCSFSVTAPSSLSSSSACKT